MRRVLALLLTGGLALQPSPAPSACVAPPSGLVGWWRGENNGAEALGLYPAALNGNAAFAPGLVGQAFHFNGTPTYQPWAFRVEVPPDPALSPHADTTGETGLAPDPLSIGEMSVQAWIQIPALPTEDNPQRFVVRKAGPPGWEYALYITTNGQAGFLVSRYGGAVFPVQGGSLSTNQWHHLVGTYKKDTFVRIYIDGVQVAEMVPTFHIGSVTLSDFVIGHGGLFNGLIDEVALFRRALSGAEVQSIYQAGYTGMCLPVRLNVSAQGGGGVELSRPQPFYAIGDSVTLTATNSRYHHFLYWSDGDLSSERMVTIVLMNNYLAVFTNTVPLETLAFKQWDRSFGGLVFDNYPAVRRTLDGGYVLAGATGSGPGGNKITPSCGEAATWILKLDANGQKQWEQTVGAPDGAHYVVDIQPTSDGGYALCATSSAGTNTVNGNCGKTAANHGGYDVWLVRLDASGTRLWDRTYGGTGLDGATAIRETPDGGFLMTGQSSSPVGNTKTSPRFGKRDMWAVRTDANGNKLWDRSYGGTEDDFAHKGLTLLPDGGFIAVGASASEVNGNKTTINHGSNDFWLVRCDANGNKLWDRSFGGSADDYGVDLALMPDGGVVLVGQSESGASGNKTASHYGALDYWVVRTDENGAPLWDRAFGGSGYDAAYVVQVTPEGGVIVSGESDSDADGNKTTPSFNSSDGWVVRLDTWGVKLWEQSFGGEAYDYFWSGVGLGGEGCTFAGGSDSEPGGNKTSPNLGGEDFWIAHLVERTAPIGTPVVMVNGQFHPSNSVSVIGVAAIKMQTTFGYGWIYYTLDGSVPSSNSIPYTAPFSLAQSATVRAIAYSFDFSEWAEADAVTVSVQLCLPPLAGLVAWWPGDGNARDIAGDNHGALIGSASYVPGLVGDAFSFDGSGHVEIPHSPTLSFGVGSSMTVELWAYRTAAYLPYHIIGKRDGCGSGVEWNYMIGIDESVPETPLNTWIHWALVFEASGASVYTNGALIDAPDLILGPENTLALTIGTAGLCTPFTGLIDEVRIYDRALTPAEITLLHTFAAAGMCKPAPLPVSILVNDRFSPTNSFMVTNSATVSVQTSFTNGHIVYTLNGAHPGTGRDYSGPFVVEQSVIVRAIAYNADYSASAETDPLSITVVRSPIVTLSPASLTIFAGATATLSGEADGSPPLSYAWLFNGTLVEGANYPLLHLPSVSTDQSGDYELIISNPYGATTSSIATLTVLIPPQITSPPASLSVTQHASVVFCVDATGTPAPEYQWRKNGQTLPGETSPCLVILDVQVGDGGSYSVDVVNEGGIVSSEPAILTVELPVVPPGDYFTNRVGVAGFANAFRGTNTLASREANEPLHAGKSGSNSVWYTWTAAGRGIATFRTVGSAFDTVLGVYKGNSLGSLVEIARDEDNGSFFTSEARFNTTAGTAYAIAIDGFGGQSGDFVLTWNWESTSEELPVITAQPFSLTVPFGETATFMVTAGGTNLSYAWHHDGLPIPGGTNSWIALTSIQPPDVGDYTVAITNSFGRGVISEVATLEIGPFGDLRSRDKLEDLLFSENPGLRPASAGASVAVGSIASHVLDTANATRSAGEFNHCVALGGSSKWLPLTAGGNATFVLDTLGATFDTILAVYVADGSLGDFPTRLVACNDNVAPGVSWSRVVFAATNGVKYWVAVDGVNGASGRVFVNWALGEAPKPGAGTPTLLTPIIREGQGLTLSTTLTNGIPTPRLQWYRDQTLLANATNATLVLESMTRVNAGTYRVVSSNALGSVTSVVARVTVEVPLVLSAEVVEEQGASRMRLTGAASQSFTVQGTTNFLHWIPLFTNLLPGQPVSLDDFGFSQRNRRFYRAMPWP